MAPKAKPPKIRTCRTCKQPGTFTSKNPYQKRCDDCMRDPYIGAKYASESNIKWARARSEALAELRRRHEAEYEELLEEAKARHMVDGWPATQREVEEFQERVVRAIDEGWKHPRIRETAA